MDLKTVDPRVSEREVPLGSVALNRLISEVAACAEMTSMRGYNRTHNRHNR